MHHPKCLPRTQKSRRRTSPREGGVGKQPALTCRHRMDKQLLTSPLPSPSSTSERTGRIAIEQKERSSCCTARTFGGCGCCTRNSAPTAVEHTRAAMEARTAVDRERWLEGRLPFIVPGHYHLVIMLSNERRIKNTIYPFAQPNSALQVNVPGKRNSTNATQAQTPRLPRAHIRVSFRRAAPSVTPPLY